MKESILKFMQKEDPNGDWDVSEANEIPEAYMLETLQNWLDDGLEVNPRIQGYIDYLGKFI